MASTITTVSVHPERAAKLREFRDAKDLPSMDAALEELLNQKDETVVEPSKTYENIG